MKSMLRLAAAVLAGLVLYLGVTFVQVWRASLHDEAQPAGAIVVLGAAQYNGVPSPVLRARLDHAADLYEREAAPAIWVTGGRQPGDRFTEATASAAYLHTRGVPDRAIRRIVDGRSTWESLAAAARYLHDDGVTNVLLVSDPYHSYRAAAIAEELGLHAHVSPTRANGLDALRQSRALVRETIAVALGRVVGYGRLTGLVRTASAGVPVVAGSGAPPSPVRVNPGGSAAPLR